MNLRLLCLWMFAVFPLSAAARDGTVPVNVEEFLGGTGATAAELLRADLEYQGMLSVTDQPAKWTIRGSSSAGRIDGALVNEKGEIVFNSHYDAPDLRDNAHAFADEIIESITGTPGIATTKIAYVSNRGGKKDIYLADSDGQRVQRITRDGLPKGAPSLGPGSLLMAWTSYASGYADIVLTDLRDGEKQVILGAPGTNSGAAISPDGTRLAATMSHEGNPEIYLATLAGGNPQRLTFSKSVEFSPAWSPDGKRLVFCSDATGSPQLYLSGLEGGEAQRLDTGYKICTSPDWCPDGVRIAFTGRQGGGPSVVVFDLNSGKSRVLVQGAEDPVWAPDGRHLACVRGGDLIVVDTIRDRRRVVVRDGGRVSEPSWSK